MTISINVQSTDIWENIMDYKPLNHRPREGSTIYYMQDDGEYTEYTVSHKSNNSDRIISLFQNGEFRSTIIYKFKEGYNSRLFTKE